MIASTGQFNNRACPEGNVFMSQRIKAVFHDDTATLLLDPLADMACCGRCPASTWRLAESL
jgi:hypothetical protein